MAGPTREEARDGNHSNDDMGGAMQLLPRHRYMLQKVDAAFGIYDESTTEFMFLHHGVMDKVCYVSASGSLQQYCCICTLLYFCTKFWQGASSICIYFLRSAHTAAYFLR